MLRARLASFKFYPDDFARLEQLRELLRTSRHNYAWSWQTISKTDAIRQALKDAIDKHTTPTSDKKSATAEVHTSSSEKKAKAPAKVKAKKTSKKRVR